MYPVSSEYLETIQQDDREFYSRAFIQPVNGTPFWIYDEHMLENSLILSEHVVPGDAIAFGGTVAASLSVGFYNPDGQYDGIQFNGAQVNPSVGLVTSSVPTWSIKIATEQIQDYEVLEERANSIALRIWPVDPSGRIRLMLYNRNSGLASDIEFDGEFPPPPDPVYHDIFVGKNDTIFDVGETDLNRPPLYEISGAPDETIEWIPLGVFLVDSAKHAVPYQRSPVNRITLQAMDRLIMLEQPFLQVGAVFPITAAGLLTAVCAYCGLSRATSATSFLNDNYVIATRPDGDMSCRDIVGYIAELAGCFARSDRYGNLEFVWFKNPAADTPDVTLQPLGRINFSIEDAPIVVSGVSYEGPDGTIRVGEEGGEYDLALSSNPLISSNPEPILQSLYSVVEGFSYLPCTTDRHDDPALQAGDMVLHPDVSGNDYASIVTSYEYKYRGLCTLQASGLSPLTAGWRSKFEKQVSTLQRRINNAEDGQLNAFADAVGLAFGMLAGVTGGYKIVGDDLGDPQYAGKTFLTDHPDLMQAQVIWQYSLGGIGMYANGINSPPQSAWTADGRLVMPIVNADQIFAGTLMSNDGKSFFQLDGNSLLQTNNINITGGSIAIPGEYVSVNIDGNGLIYRNPDGDIVLSIDISKASGGYRMLMQNTYGGSFTAGAYKAGAGGAYARYETSGVAQHFASAYNMFSSPIVIDSLGGIYLESSLALGRKLFSADDIYTYIWIPSNGFFSISAGQSTVAQFRYDGSLIVNGNAAVSNLGQYMTFGDGYQYYTRLQAGTRIIANVGGYDVAYMTSSGLWQTSSESVKENIAPAKSVLADIMRPQIFQYDYKEKESPILQKKTKRSPTYGFVLGDGYTPPPEEIATGDAVNLYSMTAMLWKGLQELAAKCDSYEQRITELERRLANAESDKN